jgi:hypothetical protein
MKDSCPLVERSQSIKMRAFSRSLAGPFLTMAAAFTSRNVGLGITALIG